MWVAVALNKQMNHLTVCLFDRPRHEPLIKSCGRSGVGSS
jgi:fructose-1,6-bisphosphatase/sedoheptulose 1,7-bisphosphatase-like protein